MNKKNLFLAIAFVLGSGAFAFAGTPKGEAKASDSEAKTEASADPHWYRFDGTTVADQSNPAMYTPVSSASCPTAGAERCEILANPSSTPGQPDLTVIYDETFKN